MARPPDNQWISYPNILGIASNALPLLSSILFGFSTSIIVLALDKDFISEQVFYSFDARETILIGASISILSFLFSITSSMYCHALDYRGFPLHEWVGKGAEDNAKNDCKSRALTLFKLSIVFFYIGLFSLLTACAVAISIIHIIPVTILILGILWAVYNLYFIIKTNWEELK